MRKGTIRAATIAAVAFFACAALAIEIKAPNVGEVAPNFMLRDRDGAMVSLHLLSGEKVLPANRKVVVLDFFQTTCKPCLEELPSLQSFHAKWKNDPRVKFYMVGVGEDAEKLAAFANEKGVEIPMLADPFLVTAKAYGAFTFPTTVIVDKNKKIRFYAPKKMENIEALLNENISKILAEP